MGKVIVVGLYGMSALFQVECLPREGETVLAGELVFEPGGKGYNQAVAAGRMGAEVFFATAVGRDFYGACAEQEMERDGIRRRQISTRERGTAFAAVFTDGRGDNSVVVHPGACTQLNRGWARELEREIAQADVLLTQLEFPLEVVEEVLKIARHHSTYTILNPAPACDLPRGILELTDLLTPNWGEALNLSGGKEFQDPGEVCQKLQKDGAGHIVVTLGDRGAFLAEQGGSSHHQTPYLVDCVNSAGAGGTFNGALAARIARGDCLRGAVRLASAASALAVSRAGVVAAIPGEGEVAEFLEKRR